MKPREQNVGAMTRRAFLAAAGRGASLLALGGVTGVAATHWHREPLVWQIDPFKCTEC